MFHNNFWPYVEMDLATGQWVERENLLPTRESLYKMTDADWMYENLKDDLALQMYVFAQGYTSDIDIEAVGRLARRLDLPARNLEVLQGERSRLKLIRVAGLAPEQLRAKLEI